MSCLPFVQNLDKLDGVTFTDEWKACRNAILLHWVHVPRLGHKMIVADWKVDGLSMQKPPLLHDLRVAFEDGKRSNGLMESVGYCGKHHGDPFIFDDHHRCFLSQESPLVRDMQPAAPEPRSHCSLETCTVPPVWTFWVSTWEDHPIPGFSRSQQHRVSF